MSNRKIWLIVAIVVIVGGISLAVLSYMTFRISTINLPATGSRIAVVELNGTILESRSIVRQFKMYRRDRSIKAIVFRINSPGGGISASQEIYEAVKKCRDSGKVIIASMGAVAASGGYYVAMGADSIMANPGTTTGSIGVIVEIPNIRGLLSKIGVDFTIIKSGEFKDTGSPYRKMTQAERRYLQGWVDDAFAQFVNAVVDGRGMEHSDVLEIADGRVFTGKQAFEMGLIDTLGTYEDAIRLAADAVGIEGEPRIVTQQRRRRMTLFDLLFGDLRHIFEYVQSWPRMKYQMVF